MIGTIMGVIKVIAAVCLLLIVVSVALLLLTVVATILQSSVDTIFRRKK